MPSSSKVEEAGYGVPPAHFDPRLHQMFQYWEGKRGQHAMPLRSDLEPIIEIPRLLSGVWLLEVQHPDLRFRYRLLGNDVITAGDLPKVGDYLDERPRVGNINETISAFKEVCRTRQPYWRKGMPHLRHDKLVAGLQLISLPIWLDHPEEVGLLMNLTVYDWQKLN